MKFNASIRKQTNLLALTFTIYRDDDEQKTIKVTRESPESIYHHHHHWHCLPDEREKEMFLFSVCRMKLVLYAGPESSMFE